MYTAADEFPSTFIFALAPSDLIVPPVVAAIPTTPVPSILTSPVLVTVELLAAIPIDFVNPVPKIFPVFFIVPVEFLAYNPTDSEAFVKVIVASVVTEPVLVEYIPALPVPPVIFIAVALPVAVP